MNDTQNMSTQEFKKRFIELIIKIDAKNKEMERLAPKPPTRAEDDF